MHIASVSIQIRDYYFSKYTASQDDGAIWSITVREVTWENIFVSLTPYLSPVLTPHTRSGVVDCIVTHLITHYSFFIHNPTKFDVIKDATQVIDQ